MSRAAIIGDRDLISVFSALGFETLFISNREQAEEALRRAAVKKLSPIYILERWAEQVLGVIEELREKQAAVIVYIPDHKGTTGLGWQRVRESSIRAIGTDAIFREKK
jgi:V/A-type H+-transporting ATPase subunit F